MTPSFPSIALSEENCIAPLDSKVKTLRTHACPYLCRLAYRRKPSWVTACRHRPLRTVYISGCWHSTRAQPRHGRGPCGVAAGELHSTFGSHGPHGSTLILYPAIVSLYLYRSQTNCECAKHQRIISDLVNLYSLELYRHFQSEFIFVDVTCACRSRQMFGSYTLGRGNFRRLASIQQLCGLRMCRPSDLKITKVCSSGGKPRSKPLKTTPPNDIIKPRLNWGGLMLLRVLLHIRLYPLREKMPRAMRKAVLVLCNEVCRTLCRLDARAR